MISARNIIPSIIKDYRVYAYPFRDPETSEQAYWRDVGTLDAFWEANMELVSVTPQLNLYDQKWPIFTHQTQAPPAKFVFDDPDRRGDSHPVDGVRRLRRFRLRDQELAAVLAGYRQLLQPGIGFGPAARRRDRREMSVAAAA